MKRAVHNTAGAAATRAKDMGISRNSRYSDIELKQEQSGARH